MTNQEIDRRLALAIGYTADRVRLHPLSDKVYVLNDLERWDGPMQYSRGQRFDHTDPAVIWPIAERFDAFPICTVMCEWLAHGSRHDHPATASALAVIQYVEGKAHE